VKKSVAHYLAIPYANSSESRLEFTMLQYRANWRAYRVAMYMQ